MAKQQCVGISENVFKWRLNSSWLRWYLVSWPTGDHDDSGTKAIKHGLITDHNLSQDQYINKII